MLHYPPANDKQEPSQFISILENYDVETVVYVHLHTAETHNTGIQGKINNTNYILTSADYLDFKPILVYK